MTTITTFLLPSFTCLVVPTTTTYDIYVTPFFLFSSHVKKLKEKFRDVAQGGLFGGLLKAEQFVATIFPANYDHTVSIAAHFLCFIFACSYTC